MLDTLSPENYLQRAHREDTAALQDQRAAYIRALREAAWNALIPPCAMHAHIAAGGQCVRYLHPTKGWKTIGKRRFAIRGVL